MGVNVSVSVARIYVCGGVCLLLLVLLLDEYFFDFLSVVLE